MTQEQKVIKYMQEHGSVTQRDAYKFGCYRLASRISDMKRDGTPIHTEYVMVKNADGSKSRIAVYSLEEKDGTFSSN